MLGIPQSRSIFANGFAAGLCCLGLLSGCESSGWTRKLERAFASSPERGSSAQEEHFRRKYVGNHDREALYWLLRNRITSGMPYKEVCRTLGEEGTRESRDNWIKTNGGNYQLGDDAYAFGPDSEGQTVYLVFRDHKLVNFDPTEFSAMAHRRSDGED